MLNHINKIISSPAWGFWQFVISLAALIAAYNIFLLQKDEKLLQVSYSVSSVVEIQQDLQSQIDLFYQGLPFDDIAIIEYKIENVGNIPILERDFVLPITFSVNSDWFIVGSDTAIPPGGSLIMEIDPKAELPGVPEYPTFSKFDITPQLLNPGEGWHGKLVVITDKAGSPINFNVGSHIVGIREIQKIDLTKDSPSEDTLMKKYLNIGVVLGILISLFLWSTWIFVSYILKSKIPAEKAA